MTAAHGGHCFTCAMSSLPHVDDRLKTRHRVRSFAFAFHLLVLSFSDQFRKAALLIAIAVPNRAGLTEFIMAPLEKE